MAKKSSVWDAVAEKYNKAASEGKLGSRAKVTADEKKKKKKSK
jgi:hypothetical protein